MREQGDSGKQFQYIVVFAAVDTNQGSDAKKIKKEAVL